MKILNNSNPSSILIEQQKGHTKFEQVTRIHLSIFQLI